MKTLATIILVLAAAAVLATSGPAVAGTPVTVRDVTEQRDDGYEKWAKDHAARKSREVRTCRADKCPVRGKAAAPAVEAPAKPAPFLGGFKLLPL